MLNTSPNEYILSSLRTVCAVCYAFYSDEHARINRNQTRLTEFLTDCIIYSTASPPPHAPQKQPLTSWVAATPSSQQGAAHKRAIESVTSLLYIYTPIEKPLLKGDYTDNCGGGSSVLERSEAIMQRETAYTHSGYCFTLQLT